MNPTTVLLSRLVRLMHPAGPRPPALAAAAVLALAPLWAGGAQAAEVWKCKVGDQVRYSDQPCAPGETGDPRTLKGNVIDTSSDRALQKRRGADGAGEGSSGTAGRPGAAGQRAPHGAANGTAQDAPSNVCPSGRDLANMETRASSIRLSPEAKAFMQDEIRRARQCQKGQGRYTAADWAISQQAQDAQSSLSGGADARRRAEDMHSAADPAEGDRIARQREQDRREAQRREDRLLRDRR